MTRYASVVRDGDGLERLAKELDTATPRVLRSRTDFEDVALTAAAGAVAVAALARTESRGCHHRSDFTEPDPAQAHSVPLMREAQRPVPAMGCS
jgi:L-aspartate oxidase